nr:immunoglobulin heavy chain junction region [Mus musculus]
CARRGGPYDYDGPWFAYW